MYLKIQRGKKVLDSGCEAMNGYQGEEEEAENRNGKELGDLENIVVGEPSLGVKKGISDERGKENTMRTVWKMWEEERKYHFEPTCRLFRRGGGFLCPGTDGDRDRHDCAY